MRVRLLRAALTSLCLENSRVDRYRRRCQGARAAHADRGRSWKIAETPLIAGPSAGIFSVAFRDAMHGVIVGGDYRKENEALDNLAVTSDGGVTWTLVKGLSGFRSVVAYVPSQFAGTLVAVGPSGADYSTDDGRTWKALEGPGFDTLSFTRGRAIAYAAGARGSIGKLTFYSSRDVFVAERRLNLAQPLKAGITGPPILFVASATVECSIVADATQIQKHFLDPGLRRPG